MVNPKNGSPTVFIAIPVHDNTIHVKCMSSLINSTQNILNSGFNYVFRSRRGALINRTRNELVSDFMASDSDYLFFTDNDGYGFEHSILTCLNYLHNLNEKERGYTIVGGSYAIKQLDINRFNTLQKAASIKDKESVEYQELCKYLLRYNVNYYKASITIQEVLDTCRKGDGWVQVKHLGGAYHVMHRSVVENLMKANPALQYKPYDNEKNTRSDEYLYNLYHSYVSPEDGHYISEDYGFSELLTTIGGKAFCNLNFSLGHCGTYDYEGAPFNHVEFIAEKIEQENENKEKNDNDKDKGNKKSKKKK